MSDTTPALTDKRGTVFDPARHLSRDGVPVIHPHTQLFMPRRPKGIKNKPRNRGDGSTAPVPGAGSVEPVGGSAAEKPALPAATAPSAPPPATVPAAGTTQPAPSFDDIAPLLNQETSPAEASPEKAADKSTADADIVCRAAQLATGLVLDPDEARPTKGDHENMAEATASLLRAKGWQLPATIAAVLLFGIYVLSVLNKPKSRAKFKDWLERQKNPGGAPVVDLPAETGGARSAAPAASAPTGKTIPPLAPTPYSSP